MYNHFIVGYHHNVALLLTSSVPGPLILGLGPNQI